MSHISGARSVANRQYLNERVDKPWPACSVCGERDYRVSSRIIGEQSLMLCPNCISEAPRVMKERKEFEEKVRNSRDVMYGMSKEYSEKLILERIEPKIYDKSPTDVVTDSYNQTHPELKEGEIFFGNSSLDETRCHPDLKTLRAGAQAYERDGKPIKGALLPWFVNEDEYRAKQRKKIDPYPDKSYYPKLEIGPMLDLDQKAGMMNEEYIWTSNRSSNCGYGGLSVRR